MRAFDLQSNLRIMSVALQPGFEDLSALAYFRFAKGAKVLSVYVTNGESLESDLGSEYPHMVAARRKKEAFQAMQALQTDEYFLNLPDFGASRDTSQVRLYWPTDTIRSRLMYLISEFRPDVILLASNKLAIGKNTKWSVIFSDLVESVKRLYRWQVRHIIGDVKAGSSLELKIRNRHTLIGETYHDLGEQAALAYQSMRVRRQAWSRRSPVYSALFSTTSLQRNSLDERLWPRKPTPRLRLVDGRIRNVSSQIISTVKTRTPDEKERAKYIRDLIPIQDSVESHIVRSAFYLPIEQRLLLDWRDGLERLRNSLSGIKVMYSISEENLVERQLTFLTIDTVFGVKGHGTAELVFHGVAQGWLVNEVIGNRVPLILKQPYRLLSPLKVAYSLPASTNGLLSPKFGTTFTFTVSYRSSVRDESFDFPVTQRIVFAPKFTVEVFPPVVKVSEREYVTVKLTNHSRDPISDVVSVSDSLAWSNPSKFRIAKKDSSHVDTLFMTWRPNIPEGKYQLPVQIHGINAARVVAIQFHVAVDTSRRVGIVSAWPTSIIAESLRRLQLKPKILSVKGKVEFTDLDAIIVERRALSFVDSGSSLVEDLAQFAKHGGHVIALAQDASAWNRQPLLKGLTLQPGTALDEHAPVVTDSSHRLLVSPNRISESDWDGWIFYRAFNSVPSGSAASMEVPVKSLQDRTPFVVSRQTGRGRITYVDLALDFQLFNVQAGAFRLLANLISD